MDIPGGLRLAFIFMKWKGLLLFLILCLLPPLARADYAQLVQAFAQIRTNTVWPVQGGSADDIEETFGPRRQPSNNGAYDWHRGLDIDHAHGQVIVAAYAGEFFRYTNFTSGGHTVILRHRFPTPVPYLGKSLQYFYTYHMHLDDALVPQWVKDAQAGGTRPEVTAGQQIGYMGSSGQGPGEDYAVHLHFELRVGSQSSLEFQLGNIATNSASYYGFDPHMHPLLLFQPTPTRILLSEVTPLTTTQDGTVLITIDNDDQPNLNRVEVRIYDRRDGSLVKEHALDLNQRTGFDASSTAQLDARDLTKPYFAPLYFTDAQTNYQTQLVIPKVFVGPDFDEHQVLNVVARDIWGRTTQLPVAPALHVERTGNQNLLHWPVAQGDFRLQTTTNLFTPNSWSIITNVPAFVNGTWQVTWPQTEPQRFFRLVLP